jgi:hypothetical protein
VNRVPLPLNLAQSAAAPVAGLAAVLASTVGARSRYTPPGHTGDPQVVVPGQPSSSVLALRMQSRQLPVQMPPLGTSLPDPEGLALVHRWIGHALAIQDSEAPKETLP